MFHRDWILAVSFVASAAAPGETIGTTCSLPSFARQRASSLLRPGVGLYTVSLQLGQLRYAIGCGEYPVPQAGSTRG